jgi:hypothetical protein
MASSPMQEKSLSSAPNGQVIKNLFLKDKKNRLYLTSALASTTVDLKILSARLGLGKGGINMAPSGLVQQLLKVPEGSVTPFAALSLPGSELSLLLDQKILTAESIFVHPMVNTSSLQMKPDALTTALKIILGRDPSYVDLESEPKIDKENPPDLAKFVPESVNALVSAAATPSSDSTEQASVSQAPPASKQKASSKATKNEAESKPDAVLSLAAQHRALCDVHSVADQLMREIAKTLMGCKIEECDSSKVAAVRANVEMLVNSLKNAAYASGYTAGKGEVVAAAERRFA